MLKKLIFPLGNFKLPCLIITPRENGVVYIFHMT
jgi:hypothetical protein